MYKRIHYFSVLIFVGIFVITGCVEVKKSNSHETDWEQGHGTLPSEIGTHDNTFLSPDSLIYLPDAASLENLTEYAKPSGKWLMHNGEGKFGYGMSSGTNKANEKYSIHLMSHQNNGEEIDRHIRIQLTERDKQLDLLKVIHDETVYVDVIDGEKEIYTNTLPNEENVIYILSMEFLNEHGDVEDTMITVIYVPIQEMNALLKTDKQTYQSSETAILTLENFGPSILLLDTYYTIEKEIEGIWRIVPLDLTFEDIGIMLSPHDQYDQVVELASLTSGKYRIIKNIRADGTDLTATLASEFTVE